MRACTFILLACMAMPAAASSFAGTSAGATSGGASASTGSTSGNDKVLVEARVDAAGFVATDGRIRGVRLEAALRHLREHSDAARSSSDLELARHILAL